MSAANCCPKPGYGATSEQDGKSGSYTGEVNACGEAHEPSLGGFHALDHWARCHEPDQARSLLHRLGGPLPGFWGALLEEVESALLLDSKALAAHFRLYCQHYDLKEQMSDVV